MFLTLSARGSVPLAFFFGGGDDARVSGQSVRDDPFERRSIESARGGDANAYDYLVAKYGKKVLGIAAGLVRNRQDAEDLAQEAFVRGYESLSRFRAGEAFGPWISRIVTNLSLDMLRQRKRRGEETGEPELDLPASDVSPESAIASRQASVRISRAIRSLPEMQRAVAQLYLVEELSHAEIAEMTGVSEGTVRSHLFHARAKLKEALKDLER